MPRQQGLESMAALSSALPEAEDDVAYPVLRKTNNGYKATGVEL